MSENVWNIKEVMDEIITRVNKNLDSVGNLIQNEVKSEISSMGAVKTGKYKNSIDYSVNTDETSVIISSDVEYSIFVELGTSKMSPRPAFRYALAKNENKIKDLINK